MVMSTGVLYLAREARDALGPRVKAAVERYCRPPLGTLPEGETDTTALLSRGFEWAEDVFPAVALGCAGLAANNQVPITILTLAFAWILFCRTYRWWLQQADAQDNAAAPQERARSALFLRLWRSVFRRKQRKHRKN